MTAEARGYSDSPATPGATSDLKTQSATDFGAFDAAVSASASNEPLSVPNTAFAELHSQLLPTSMMMSGRVGGQDNRPDAEGYGVGSSAFKVVFDLDSDSPARVDFLAVTTGGAITTVTNYSFSLAGPSGFGISFGGNQFRDRGFTETLTAGVYTLTANFANGGRGNGTSGNGNGFFVALTAVPEPAAACTGGGLLWLLSARRRQTRG